MSALRQVARTPREAWPAPQHRGKPGYSARHFASLNAGNENSPLQVAERCADRALRERLSVLIDKQLAEGATRDELAAFWDREYSPQKWATWERLCGSFDAVIAALEADPGAKFLKQQIREAKAAKRRAGL